VIIVGGTFEVDPKDRDAFIAGRIELMGASRSEPGCLDYSFSADPIEAGRVILFERWETQAHLDAHLAALATGPQPSDNVTPVSVSVVFYDATDQASSTH